MSLFHKKKEEEKRKDELITDIVQMIGSDKSISHAPQEPPSFEEAKEYFRKQSISCSSEADKKAIIRAYRAITEQKDVTFWSEDAEDAVEEHDNNAFRLCKALLYQNFMIMRKIDNLSKRIEQLEK